MKLAFCVKDLREPNELDDRFGRSNGFILVDSDEETILEVLENEHKDSPSGAGTGSLQLLFDKGVEGIIGPEVGPKAFDGLMAADVPFWKQGASSTWKEALSAWSNGHLVKVARPLAKGLHRA